MTPKAAAFRQLVVEHGEVGLAERYDGVLDDRAGRYRLTETEVAARVLCRSRFGLYDPSKIEQVRYLARVGVLSADQVLCKRGHPQSAANQIRNIGGFWACRVCRNLTAAAWAARTTRASASTRGCCASPPDDRMVP